MRRDFIRWAVVLSLYSFRSNTMRWAQITGLFIFSCDTETRAGGRFRDFLQSIAHFTLDS
jgi:hypothetical protein